MPLHRSLAGGDLPVEVAAALGVVTQSDDSHDVQRPVDLALAFAGEPVPASSSVLPDAATSSYGMGPIEYSHSLTGQIGGQLAAGFCLTHLDEAPHHGDATARNMPGYFATRAVKP